MCKSYVNGLKKKNLKQMQNFILKGNLKLDSVEITNKMQPCIRIYYSTVH